MGDPLFWFWLSSNQNHTYKFNRLQYTDPQTAQYIGEIFRFSLSDCKVYTVPGSLLKKHREIEDIALAAQERVSESQGEFVPLLAHEATAIERFCDR